MGSHADHGFRLWLARGPQRIGSSYKKARYVEFTDATFTTRKSRPVTEQHLGIVGPVLRAEVNDTIKIHFKNFLSFPASMHPHGVSYTKEHEGALYADGHPEHSAGHRGDAVQPGGTHVYEWFVPDEAAFGEHSSRMWLYHSHTDETKDVNSGLVGVLIIHKRGAFDAKNNRPYDIDRELVTVFHIFDESSSHYFAHNVQQSLNESGVLTGASLAQLMKEDNFAESNRMHSINGRVYGNLEGLSAREGERVRWYVTGLGTQVDMHSAHWHGNTVREDQRSTDVVNIMPGTMVTVDMLPRNVGPWLYHCHVDHHIHGGMIAFYDVRAANASERIYGWEEFHMSVGPARWNELAHGYVIADNELAQGYVAWLVVLTGSNALLALVMVLLALALCKRPRQQRKGEAEVQKVNNMRSTGSSDTDLQVSV